MMGTRCTCGAGCATFGQCLRKKNIHLGDVRGSGTAKKWDGDLQAYYDARKQGVQPATTERADVDRAMRISQSDGEAWKA